MRAAPASRITGWRAFASCFAVASALLLAGCSSPFGTAFSRGLERLKAASVDGGRVESVKFHQAGIDATGVFTNMPSFVEVDYVLSPAPGSSIRCKLLLPHPSDWDGRFWGVGPDAPGRDFDEAIVDIARRGSASAFTDAGANRGRRRNVVDAGAKRPETWKDFGWRGVHLMARESKRLAEIFYGREVEHSYFLGSGAAGGQALMLAQRFPEDFDAILAVAPESPRTAVDLFALHVARNAHDDLGRPVFTESQSRAIAAAASGCDGKFFTPETERRVFAIASRLDRSLMDPELRVRWHRVFEGVRRKKGSLVYEGLPLGAYLGTLYRRTPWSLKWCFGADADLFSLSNADLERYVREVGREMDASNPDLSAFSGRGGKLLVVAGLVDPVVPFGFVRGYADAAARKAGGAERLGKFALFVPVPGMGHRAAPTGEFGLQNLEAALEKWREKGEVPPFARGSKSKVEE